MEFNSLVYHELGDIPANSFNLYKFCASGT